MVKEGYRPLHIQQRAFDRALQRAKLQFPNKNSADLIAEASKYVATPNIALHPTGGASDLTLVDVNGSELDLGTPMMLYRKRQTTPLFLTQPILAKKLEKTGKSSLMLFNLSVL
ncbi:hypothetical protein P9850_05470 [Anoxybacillus rupiensis]|uniref:Uncharacterized protein n=1 Tax=Anoxybacteroides rupiense TaxID=311460 RepID=A0ABD5ITN0_9BACL|nr:MULTISPECIES: hypothetical protein [Anoxybacillus]MED5051311.1 hypothetical protein [Anoxybacillus rupiensis]